MRRASPGEPRWLIYWRGEVVAQADDDGGVECAIRTHMADVSEAQSPDGDRRRGWQGQRDGYIAVLR